MGARSNQAIGVRYSHDQRHFSHHCCSAVHCWHGDRSNPKKQTLKSQLWWGLSLKRPNLPSLRESKRLITEHQFFLKLQPKKRRRYHHEHRKHLGAHLSRNLMETHHRDSLEHLYSKEDLYLIHNLE